MKLMNLGAVRNLVVIDENTGRAFERNAMYTEGVELHLQDSGATLKVFPVAGVRPNPDYWDVVADYRGRTLVWEVYEKGEWRATFLSEQKARQWGNAMGAVWPPA